MDWGIYRVTAYSFTVLETEKFKIKVPAPGKGLRAAFPYGRRKKSQFPLIKTLHKDT
jgi:hypothetical protein